MLRRDGMTLMETLVAIFVMAIGLLAVLAMFPMGCVTMARAINDDRIGHAAANAKALGNAMNVRFDAALTKNNVSAFDTPNFDNPAGGGFANAPFDGPSYPVYADPIGFNSYSGLYKSWIAGNSTSAIRRVAPSFAPTSPNTLKYCTLLDDITFGPNGVPPTNKGQPSSSSGTVERNEGVSWAWMLQRPKAGNPACCNMWVVIYNQRPLNTVVQISGREVAYGGTFNPALPTLVTLNIGSLPMPQVKEGGWILDATPSQSGGKNVPGNATFYRVDSVGDNIGGTVQLTLATQMQGAATGRSIVVMDGVVEVIECGSGWRSGNN